MGDITQIFETIAPDWKTNLIPDEVKVKIRFLPSYTWKHEDKRSKPSILYKIFHPRIYIVKGSRAFKLDPLNREYFKSISIEEVEAEPKWTLIDFIVLGFVSYGIYNATKTYLPEVKKLLNK